MLTLTPKIERELQSSDMEVLKEEHSTKPLPVKKLRQRHHALAKLVAQGTPVGDAAIIVGYSNSRVSILQADASFAELVKFYKKQTDEIYYGLHERLSNLSKDSADELHQRLEDSPKDFTQGQLMELVKMGADRTGHGVSVSQNIDIKVGLAEKLEAGRRRLDDLKNVTPDE